MIVNKLKFLAFFHFHLEILGEEKNCTIFSLYERTNVSKVHTWIVVTMGLEMVDGNVGELFVFEGWAAGKQIHRLSESL